MFFTTSKCQFLTNWTIDQLKNCGEFVVVVLTIPIDIAPDASSLGGSFNTSRMVRVGVGGGWGASNRVRLFLGGGRGGGGGSRGVEGDFLLCLTAWVSLLHHRRSRSTLL